MAIERLPDRARSGRAVRAMVSPSAIVAAAAGAGLGLLTPAPVVAAVVLGLAAWTARVALALRPRSGRERIDPFAVGEPWRRWVQHALQSQARYRQAVSSIDRGPLHERLSGIGDRVETAVHEVWRIATQGHKLERALRALEPTRVRRRLDGLGDEEAEGPVADSLRAQLSSADRMATVAADARARLEILDARLSEVVARAIELSATQTDTAALGGVRDDVDDVLSEMEALRQALETLGP